MGCFVRAELDSQGTVQRLLDMGGFEMVPKRDLSRLGSQSRPYEREDEVSASRTGSTHFPLGMSYSTKSLSNCQ
jgi:hypothetical protein